MQDFVHTNDQPTSAFSAPKSSRPVPSQVAKALAAKENEFGNVHQGVNLDKNKWVLFLRPPNKKVGAKWCQSKK